MDKILNFIQKICKKNGREVDVKNNDYIPKVYYIGLGKTGSASILFGVQETTVHWHNENYFKHIYDIDLGDKSLYDIALAMGDKYNFKPCLVEAIREPIVRSMSILSQEIHTGREKVKDYKEFIDKVELSPDIWTYNNKWKEYFGIDIYKEFDNTKPYYYKEVDNAKLLFLKAENSDKWKEAFKKAGYEYIDKRKNDSSKRSFAKLYKKAKDNIRYPKEKLDKIYEPYKAFYTNKEIDEFKNKYL